MKTVPTSNAGGNSALSSPAPVPLVNGKIKFSIAESYEFIDPDEIKFIKGADAQCELHLTDKATPLIVSYTLKRLFEEKVLDPAMFLRVHNSYIVNTNKVRRYIKEDGGTIILNGTDTGIPVSDKYRNEVMARIEAMN